MIEKYFGDIPKGTSEIPRPKEVEPKQTAEKRVEFYDNVQLPAVVVAYHTPEMGTDDWYALSLLTQMLSQGQSSRFQKELVDKQQKGLAVGAFMIPNEDPGVAFMYGITNMGVEPKVMEEAMLAEIEKVKTGAISDEEFKKLINQAENDFVSQNQRVVGIVENLATYHTYFGNADLINTELERYTKLTKDDLKRVANKYFTKENRLVVYYLPKSEQKKG